MTQLLPTLSNELAGIVQTSGAAVVRVNARRRMPASGIIWSEEGVIVTAHHVVQQDEHIEVGLPDGRTVPASLAGRDPTTDVAVLQTNQTGLTPPQWAELDDLQVGHLVLALGRPGQTVQATLGIVSALSSESWRTPAGGQLARYLQTDVVMYPGFSGGPLVNAAGQVVGLNSSAVLRGVSLTIPAATLRPVVTTLLKHGRIRRGYLGVSTQPVRLPEAIARQLGQETGLLVAGVEPDSPADRAGLLLGDTIVTLDGAAVRHHADLLAQLNGDRVNTAVTIRLVRSGQVQDKEVTVGERR